MDAAVLSEERVARVLECARRHGIARLRVFGSLARGQAGSGSDIDLLLSMDPGRGLEDLLEFQREAAAVLGVKVDVVTEESLDGRLHRKILEQARPLGTHYPPTEEPGVEDIDYLLHIEAAIADIQAYTAGMDLRAYEGDARTRAAVERKLQIIGDAVHNLSQELRVGNPDVPWDRIYALRNILVHFYVGVDNSRVWDVVRNELGMLGVRVGELVARLQKP